MLEILGYLLCVYLFFKGVEIYQLARINPQPDKRMTTMIGAASLILCFLLAVAFTAWIERQADESRKLQQGFQSPFN
jgi:hypothetical protein